MSVRFFVTGMGRSGTKWLANALNRDPSVHVLHEPFAGIESRQYINMHVAGFDRSLEFYSHRLDGIESRCSLWGQDWGEVNSYIRYAVPIFQELWDAPIAGLIRDGRMVVRSLMRRGVYVKRYPLVPPRNLTTPIEMCAWYWADTYRLLHKWDVPIYRLEDLTSDYTQFKKLCDYIGVQIEEIAWKPLSRRRINVSIKDPNPPDWDGEQMVQFLNNAADIQEAYYGWPS